MIPYLLEFRLPSVAVQNLKHEALLIVFTKIVGEPRSVSSSSSMSMNDGAVSES